MNSRIVPAYAALIAIWSTTALAIKWGVTGLPFSLALLTRFGLAAMLAATLMLWRNRANGGQWLPLDRDHCRAYVIAGGALSLSMLCSFWASQYVASGMVAVLFGLMPLATALFAARWLASPVNATEWLAISISLAGLAVIFSQNLGWSRSGLPSMLALLLAMTLQAGAAVLLKRYAASLSSQAVNAGGLLICAVLSLLFWLASSAPLPEQASGRALAALVYLASIGSVLAGGLYYWLIGQCRPISVALISLITPATSLWLGHWLNDEVLHAYELWGTALIMLGLVLHVMQRSR
ncbi:DMT family transporter [Chitinibacter sp. S2-10]|uniref:DMT family transporter n=1 Tax=Chitinibacter sp. S2-10 TaxID=3373597 RepID=UPI0039775804